MRLPLLVSVALHALAIALLLTIRAPEPPHVHFARVTPIASPYHATAAVIPKPHLPSVLPSRTAARTFRVPDRLPEAPAPPQPILTVPDPPSIQPPEVRSPESVPQVLDLPLPAVRRVVTAIGAFDVTIPSNPAPARSEITTGTFGNASVTTPEAHPSPKAPVTILSPADILSKPRPEYSEEARRLQIEGEVLLEVLFAASGEARILRTIRGLGHGLDENAISAARKIHFRPAQRDGAAVDSTAVVHIVFQLAY